MNFDWVGGPEQLPTPPCETRRAYMYIHVYRRCACCYTEGGVYIHPPPFNTRRAYTTQVSQRGVCVCEHTASLSWGMPRREYRPPIRSCRWYLRAPCNLATFSRHVCLYCSIQTRVLECRERCLPMVAICLVGGAYCEKPKDARCPRSLAYQGKVAYVPHTELFCAGNTSRTEITR